MTESNSLIYLDFDWGEFRYAVARFVKLLIRARWKCEPGFLPKTDLDEWQLTGIEKDPASAGAILAEAATCLDRLSSRFLPGCSSGGFPCKWDSESTPVGRLQAQLFELTRYDYDTDICLPLREAANRLRKGEEISWLALVNWDEIPAIRNNLNKLPHPRDKVASTSHGNLNPESSTSSDGKNSATPFIPTQFQLRLLAALDGKAFTVVLLEKKLKVDRKQLYRDGIKPLKARGLIQNSRRVGGYYRPNKPPAWVAEWLDHKQ